MEIKLKLRDRSDDVRVPVPLIVTWLGLDEGASKNAMFTFFSSFKENKARIHDKTFLETTINWIPTQMTERGPISKGMFLIEQMRWLRIAQDLDEIDETKEGILDLRSKDIDLIINRWKDPEFKLESIHQRPWLAAFVMEFQITTGRWIDDDLEKEYKEDHEERAEVVETKGKENERESERAEVSTDG
jgi:hypothetical protein